MESLVNFFFLWSLCSRMVTTYINENRGCLKNHDITGKGIILHGRNKSIENRIESMRSLVLDKIKLENLFRYM